MEARQVNNRHRFIIRLQVGWVVFCSVVSLGCVAIAIWAHWPEPREATVYAFRLPVMFLGCFHYRPADGETLAGWDFEQPAVIEVDANMTLFVNGGRYVGCYNEAIFHMREAADEALK